MRPGLLKSSFNPFLARLNDPGGAESERMNNRTNHIGFSPFRDASLTSGLNDSTRFFNFLNTQFFVLLFFLDSFNMSSRSSAGSLSIKV